MRINQSSKLTHFHFKLSTSAVLITGLMTVLHINTLHAKSVDTQDICFIQNSDPTHPSPVRASIQNLPLKQFDINTHTYNSSKPVFLFDKTLNESAPIVEVPDSYHTDKFHFRSSWIATINNLTMPKTDSTLQFKEAFSEHISQMNQMNMNAVIFQVRPELDAWYLSKINPWSAYINSNQQGKNNFEDNNFDPLAYMIEVSHNHSMEFHAWFNPYRVTSKKITQLLPNEAEEKLRSLSTSEQIALLAKNGVLAENNFAVLHPEAVLQFDEKFFLDPSNPIVIAHIVETVKEVLEQYDVDAIHFDDYFYPYRVNTTIDGKNVPKFFGDKNEDSEAFKLARTLNSDYTDDIAGLESWRRDNITKLIVSVKSIIDEHNDKHNRSVQFGISPFGIWEHKQVNSAGTNTPLDSTQSHSKSIYADTKSWVENRYLDYIIPQIYWSFEKAAAPYGELATWWNQLAQNNNHLPEKSTLLYIGHANYKHFHNSGFEKEWQNPEEIPNQLRFNQTLDNVLGSVYFSLGELTHTDASGMPSDKQIAANARVKSNQLLKDNYFTYPTLVPSKPWLDKMTTQPVQTPTFIINKESNILNQFTWKDDPNNDVRYYVIYRALGAKEDVSKHPENIIAKIPRNQLGQYQFTDKTQNDGRQYTYMVSSIDRAQVETDAVEVGLERSKASESNLECLPLIE
ncbi:glycoside hydrolase family 10 protein [Thorsellia anophelis]|uniref:Uncharacterized lipoprotein YddW, UPF0748 family n=1 Tax=Thorsellia anophelis DSM 18579 TaxID=1123402 RepID=A0A1I0AVX9_9GAMM|nr:family 10 glycosylhydrolase [Thorsellia anophelis]SES98534.1 Uncharacterized lipoprotein YddW, UPF0748 family [Thorsellia anophelis DSM 18579]